MKIVSVSLLMTLFCLAFGATPAKKKPAATKATLKKGTPVRHSTTSKRKPQASALTGVTGPRNHQAAPTPERYKEIQQALVSKGYLKTEPNGVWDSDSAGAMRQFQTDQKLDPNGKINAPSLIGLGLGPQKPVPAAPVPAPQ